MRLSNKWVKSVLYLLFGCSAFLIFLYVTFPFDLVQEKMVRLFEAHTDCKTDVREQTHSFPIRLTWNQVALICPMGPPLQIESVEMDIAALPALLKKKGEIDFRIQMSGTIKGHLSIDRAIDQAGNDFVYSLKQEGVGIDLRPVGFLGVLNMKSESHWIGEAFFQGKGIFSFTMNDVRVDPNKPESPLDELAGLSTLAGISALSFSTVHGEMSWQKNKISIGTFSADGESAKITDLEGEIAVQTPFSGSNIAITSKVLPKGRLQQFAALLLPNYSAPLTLDIRGGLKSPRILINGNPVPTF